MPFVMEALFRFLKGIFEKSPLSPLQNPESGFETVPDDVLLEEEQFDGFKEEIYYPVQIGEVIIGKYQVIGKKSLYVSLKVYTRGDREAEEFKTYEALSKGSKFYRGFRHLRTALDMFMITVPKGNHECLVQEPMWDTLPGYLARTEDGRFSELLFKMIMAQVFLALDYLHNEAKLVHTDIKADILLIKIADDTIFDALLEVEMSASSARKVVNGHPIYASRSFDRPKKLGAAVLGDFGSVEPGDSLHFYDAQPEIYRSSECMLTIPWSYPIDIWNVGCMVCNLFEGKHLFFGLDPIHYEYKTRAHLAEAIVMIGPPPLDLLKKGERSKEFFDEAGNFFADVPLPDVTMASWEENSEEGPEKTAFLEFVTDMVKWVPEERKTAKEMLKSAYLKGSWPTAGV